VPHPCNDQQNLLAEVDADNVVHHGAVVWLNWDNLSNNPSVVKETNVHIPMLEGR
jgi:hypothetical protein